MNTNSKIGILGFGSFSRFIAPILAKYATVYIYTREQKYIDLVSELKSSGSPLYAGTGSDIAELDYFIFSVPLGALGDAAKLYSDKLSPNTVIIDVTSVKEKPLAILAEYYPKHQILGTHPIFGPQSGKSGIAGLPIVLCNVSVHTEKYQQIRQFLSDILKLTCIEQTPLEHDTEIAYVQGLSHFIGRALKQMNIQDYAIATQSYKQLLELVSLIGDDSFELYKTIQNGNERTAEVRKQFLETLASIEKSIQ
jgi:prephenate dehydrogenase